MTRRTITLPDDLDRLLQHEARRRDTTFSELARRALAEHVGHREGRREVPFAGLGSSGYSDTAERMEELLAEEWADPRRDR